MSGIKGLRPNGRIVGMITTSTNVLTDNFPGTAGGLIVNQDNLALGVSQRFMRCVLRALIKSYCQQKVQHQTVLVSDPNASNTFYNYRKGFLGITYELVNGRFFASSVLGITGATGASCRRILGIAAFPFGTTGAAGLTGVIAPGDILTHVNCVEIGNLPDQLPLSTFDWRKIAGECARFTYVTQASQYNLCAETKVTYAEFPFEFDYSPLYYAGTALTEGVL